MEARIWNKKELECMYEWNLRGFFWKKEKTALFRGMVGKTVKWCKEQGFSVTPVMIAQKINIDEHETERAKKIIMTFLTFCRNYHITPKYFIDEKERKAYTYEEFFILFNNRKK
jgi:hypothetical protein